MTACVHGDHEFPDEDEHAAHCAEHGVTLLWHGDPITDDDLTPPAAPDADESEK